MDLPSPITSIPGVGESYAGKLSRLNINSVFDLLYHLPSRYEDRTNSIIGSVKSLKNEYTHSGKFIQLGEITTPTGDISAIWFNQSYLSKTLKVGTQVSLFGKYNFYKKRRALISPEFEIITSGMETLHTGRIVPIYPETAGVSSKWLRQKNHHLLKTITYSEIIPNLPNHPDFPNWKSSLSHIHFPTSLDQVVPARSRLAFDELFLLQLSSAVRRQIWLTHRLIHPLTFDHRRIAEFVAGLPFILTPDQLTSMEEILTDLGLPHPMNRLLEGDVGSGKTVLAAIAALAVHHNNLQTLILAPTQILAEQHFQTFQILFKNLDLRISLLTGSHKAIQPLSHIVIGTHAILSQANASVLGKVGLVVIDEQHRFGVTQRVLAAKLGSSPHILTMTATPIPRTIALTMYGNLDLSLLHHKPPGRLKIKTWVVPESKRQSSYAWINSQLITNHSQLFWVCPFIDDSETMSSVKAATSLEMELKTVFPHHRVGLLHGKMKSAKKNSILDDFRAGKINILVATPIVEVGLDIPAATLMVIEAADRFGLAQLHQLRGRVGRSTTQSYCLLFSSQESGLARLKNLENLDTGQELAEADLKLRGPGEIFGTAQHGFPDFKVATYSDFHYLELAKTMANLVLPSLNHYPLLRDLVKTDKIALIQPN